MKAVVLGALYCVVAGSILYGALLAYTIVVAWEIKVMVGTLKSSLLELVLVLVLGAGVPYALIQHIRK